MNNIGRKRLNTRTNILAGIKNPNLFSDKMYLNNNKTDVYEKEPEEVLKNTKYEEPKIKWNQYTNTNNMFENKGNNEIMEEEFFTPRNNEKIIDEELLSPNDDEEFEFATPRQRPPIRFGDDAVRSFFKSNPVSEEAAESFNAEQKAKRVGKYGDDDIIYYKGRLATIVGNGKEISGLKGIRYQIRYDDGQLESYVSEDKIRSVDEPIEDIPLNPKLSMSEQRRLEKLRSANLAYRQNLESRGDNEGLEQLNAQIQAHKAEKKWLPWAQRIAELTEEYGQAEAFRIVRKEIPPELMYELAAFHPASEYNVMKNRGGKTIKHKKSKKSKKSKKTKKTKKIKGKSKTIKKHNKNKKSCKY
jgi:hypothetical protein